MERIYKIRLELSWLPSVSIYSFADAVHAKIPKFIICFGLESSSLSWEQFRKNAIQFNFHTDFVSESSAALLFLLVEQLLR